MDKINEIIKAINTLEDSKVSVTEFRITLDSISKELKESNKNISELVESIVNLLTEIIIREQKILEFEQDIKDIIVGENNE